MANMLRGPRPDLTPAQIVSGIPILAELLHTFGVYDLSRAQQDSLAKTATWALGLIAGDAILRIGRSVSSARVQSTAIASASASAAAAPAPAATSDAAGDPAAAWDGSSIASAAPVDEAAPAPVGSAMVPDPALADDGLTAVDDLPDDPQEPDTPPPGTPPVQPSQRPAVSV